MTPLGDLQLFDYAVMGTQDDFDASIVGMQKKLGLIKTKISPMASPSSWGPYYLITKNIDGTPIPLPGGEIIDPAIEKLIRASVKDFQIVFDLWDKVKPTKEDMDDIFRTFSARHGKNAQTSSLPKKPTLKLQK